MCNLQVHVDGWDLLSYLSTFWSLKEVALVLLWVVAPALLWEVAPVLMDPLYSRGLRIAGNGPASLPCLRVM